MGRKHKSHCPHGHPYTPQNTYTYGTHWVCRTCSIANAERRALEKREECKAYRKRYYRENKAKIREKHRQYLLAHLEEQKEYQRHYHLENKERIRAQSAARRAKKAHEAHQQAKQANTHSN